MTNLIAKLNNPVLDPVVGNFNSSQDGFSSLNRYIGNFINIAFIVGSLILFFVIIASGYQYLTAGGDKDSTEKARKRLTNGFIGIVILFSVYAIINVIGVVFGLKITTINIPTI